ncbi:lytic transglycosylase domain-containing protein [Celeribacter sp.]|uniref:lytic transglycosylase domain-containing protein n=1 Tax=Celeribacter sp. TaxID=1890673 RepID=UPI003A91C541
MPLPLIHRLISRTAFVAATFAVTLSSATASPESDALEVAYQHRAAGDWDAARAAVSGLGRDIIDWHYLRAGKGSFAECQAFLERNADWPGLPLLAERCEQNISEGTNPNDVIAYFDEFPPETGEGTIALTRAYQQRGLEADAQAQAVIAWQSLSLDDEVTAYLLTHFPAQVAPFHEDRARMLLWRGFYDEARSLEPYLPDGWGALIDAASKLRGDKNGVDDAIAAIPDTLADAPILAFERFQWRMRKGRYDDATSLLLQQSTSRDALGQPEAWGERRRALARQMMRDGKARIAYTSAARHYLDPDEDHYADLEWLAGYIALRYLDEPLTALDHFNRFRVAVATPISLGRAGYWEGRALEALGAEADALAAYSFGAQFQTSFYGLLAAERASLPLDPALTGEVRFEDYSGAAFMSSTVLRSAQLLYEAGEKPLAARFMRHLGESLTPQELGQLGDLALDTHPYLAVLVAKFAADQGIVLNRAYYPLHDLADANLPVDPALALAIARRESEFNPDAMSYVGARGLMQLMPRTGEAMASKLGVDGFEESDLHDPVLNARLGSAYLAQLIEEFGANMPLVAAGYNAGPSRARDWIARYGDPRGGGVDPVDWIEHIPFRETRNYVMRVMESLTVYRARLSGETGPVTLSQQLTAR